MEWFTNMPPEQSGELNKARHLENWLKNWLDMFCTWNLSNGLLLVQNS
jgi:hypothetical protein